jgi:hypothetical protein
VLQVVLDGRDGLSQPKGLLAVGLEDMERQTLGCLDAYSGQLAELFYQLI